ncbi:hypothetical protein [Rhizobium mongolense]|uniref:hypothetical protein n=1 Tax=Rhizobium mongolense TaxID=57676 RepID=UPI0034A170FD
MGRVKELMMEYRYQEADFREIICKIYQANGYTWLGGFDETNSDPEFHNPYDIKMRSQDGEEVLFDIKIYRTRNVESTLIFNGISHVTELAVAENVRNAKIITNVDVSVFSLPGELKGVKLQVIGRNDLLSLAGSDQLKTELSEIMDEFIEAPMEAQFTPAPPTMFAPVKRRNFDPDLAIKRLQDCPVSEGTPYESACSYAIKGVFSSDFNLWTEEQHNIEERFHRLDLMGHVNSKNEFWRGLRYDFRSRYIVFEFKNYAEPITQKEIYSTEKYLFSGALRMVAIMVSRNGEDAGSLKARVGALREHGKLIMLLTNNELIEIVEAFKAGDDTHALLMANLHRMISVIGR